jgi:hypothetical protein
MVCGCMAFLRPARLALHHTHAKPFSCRSAGQQYANGYRGRASHWVFFATDASICTVPRVAWGETSHHSLCAISRLGRESPYACCRYRRLRSNERKHSCCCGMRARRARTRCPEARSEAVARRQPMDRTSRNAHFLVAQCSSQEYESLAGRTCWLAYIWRHTSARLMPYPELLTSSKLTSILTHNSFILQNGPE